MNHRQSDEIRISRWIEGELSDSDIQDLLQTDPELHELRESSLQIGNLLRQELPKPEVPYADFFNHQVLRRIEREEPEAATPRIVITVPHLVASLFQNQGLIPALAVVAILFLAVGTMIFGGNEHSRSMVLHTFSPDPDNTVVAEYNNKAGASVITIDGMKPLENDDSVFTFDHSSQDSGDMLASFAKMHRQPVKMARMNGDLFANVYTQPVLQVQ